jgi:4'-phosphopantetheinyl transferase
VTRSETSAPTAGRTTQIRWASPTDELARQAILDEVETAQLSRLKRTDDRQRHGTSRLLLKALVAELADVPVAMVRLSYTCPQCRRPHGRPVVVGPRSAERWRVSLAHAGDRVVVAASDAGPIGVDVEPLTAADFDRFDAVALTAAERARIQQLDSGDARVARATAWVRKEAILKATGDGLRVDPAHLEVSWVGSAPALLGWHAPGRARPEVQLHDLAVGIDHVAAVAILTDQSVEPVTRSVTGTLTYSGGKAGS